MKPGQKKKVESPEGEILHLSQACLHEPKDGKNYVQATVEGTTYSIACLEKGKKEHDSFDLFFDPTQCAFANKGASDVHLTGYFEPDDGASDDGAAPAAAAKSSPKVAAQASPKKSPAAVAAKSPAVAAKVSPQLAAAAKAAAAAEEDSDDDLGEEGDESEMMSGDLIEEGEESEGMEDSEEEDVPEPPKKAAKTSPAAAPAGAPKQAPAGGDQTAAYVKALVQYLKTNSGPQQIGVLGSKVPRPAGVPKMKAVFAANADKFVVKDEKVSLKK